MSRIKKTIIISLSAIALSTLSIQASDVLRGVDTRLSGLVSESQGPCGDGAVQMLFGSHALCVDIFEASAAPDCPHNAPGNQSETQNNLNITMCSAVSQPKAEPWRFVSLAQAQQLCARTGKRLPTNEEWYKIANGLADQSTCVTNNGNAPQLTGSTACVTPAGVHDVVGNVWEWIDEEVVNGQYQSRTLPAAGYVTVVDSDGIVVETSAVSNEEYGSDYAWTKPTGVYGVIRGGFYAGGTDSGIFSQNMAVPLDFKTAGVGFRCVRDI